MQLTREKKGELYILSETLLWSFFPIVTIFSLQYLDPLFSLALSSVVALFFFATVLSFKRKWHELGHKKAYKDIALSSLFIMLLYIFLFTGLQYTTATNAAVILFLQILFSFLFFNVIKNEYLSPLQIFGAFLMGSGAMLILSQGAEGFTLNTGDFLVLLAAMTAPLANHYQKRTRDLVTAHTLLFVRTLVSIPLLLLLAFILNTTPSLQNITDALPFLLINGLFLLGLSKIFWVEAIHHIPVTKAAAMTAFGPIYTMIFAYFLLEEVATLMQILGIIPVVFGGILIVKRVKRA
ncbi:MAG: DMT family transporter [Campylobacterota bacterium]